MRDKRREREEDRFSPTDRAALFQFRLLTRRTKVLRSIWCRAMAAGLVRRGGARFNELMDEIRKVADKELKR
jgi:hypothetical protein